MSGVLIIRYAVKLASNEIELCLARHDNDQDGLTILELVYRRLKAVARRLPKTADLAATVSP